jgi:hypothetical protein
MVLGILPGVLPELLFTDSCAIVDLLTLAERTHTLTKIGRRIRTDRHPRERGDPVSVVKSGVAYLVCGFGDVLEPEVKMGSRVRGNDEG